MAGFDVSGSPWPLVDGPVSDVSSVELVMSSATGLYLIEGK